MKISLMQTSPNQSLIEPNLNIYGTDDDEMDKIKDMDNKTVMSI